jgi:hypothetical protein
LTAFLTIVTESFEAPVHAEQLAGLLCNTLQRGWTLQSIKPYHKFEKSYKIELACTLEPGIQAMLEGIRITDKIASPWSIYYDDDSDTAEFIFNKNEHTKWRQTAFAHIRWAHWQVTA